MISVFEAVTRHSRTLLSTVGVPVCNCYRNNDVQDDGDDALACRDSIFSSNTLCMSHNAL